MNNQNALNLLNGVRNRLVTKGWRQGGVDFWNKYKQRCLLDAIDIASQDLNISYSETTEVEDLLRSIVCNQDTDNKFTTVPGDPYSVSLITWNDYKHRKLKHVLDVLDIAISMVTSELTRIE